MKPFRFVHASDIHLDSPFAAVGVQDPEIQKAFREATFQSFRNIVDLCLRKGADFLLVAGDVYDEANRTMPTQIKFSKELSRLADRGIRSFVVHGNHDPLDGRSLTLSYPEVVRFFDEEMEVIPVEKDGQVVAQVYGISYPTRVVTENLSMRFVRRQEPGFHIGLLHCNLNGNMDHGTYAPCTTRDLVEQGLDYWALGHIHKRSLPEKPPWIVYPGNPQGRHIREIGPKGCVVIEVDGAGQAHCVFEPTDVVRWELLEVDIQGVPSLEALLETFRKRIEELRRRAAGRHMAMRILVKGRGPLFRELRRTTTASEILDMLRVEWTPERPFVWIDDVLIQVRPDIDRDQHRQQSTFVGEILRRCDEALTPQGLAELRKILEGDPHVYGMRAVRELLPNVSDDALRDLLADAEALCLEHLLDEAS